VKWEAIALVGDIVLGEISSRSLPIFQGGGFDGANQRFAEMQLVHFEVDLEQLVHDVEHACNQCLKKNCPTCSLNPFFI
jgi:hypothetical protein